MTTRAQKFYNLTAQQVKIDSVAPTFACAIPLSGDYADSVYTVSIAYPEYIDMTAADVARYRLATHDVQPGASPLITQHIVTSRRQASLEVAFCPVVVTSCSSVSCSMCSRAPSVVPPVAASVRQWSLWASAMPPTPCWPKDDGRRYA